MRVWSANRAAGRTWIISMMLGFPSLARGQAQPAPTTGPADEAEWRRQMEARVRQLEQENVQLRDQVGDVAKTQQAVMKDAQERGFLTVEAGEPRLSTPDFFDVNKFAAEGDFPGSIKIPGTKTSFQIGGDVPLHAPFPPRPLRQKNGLVVVSLPPP